MKKEILVVRQPDRFSEILAAEGFSVVNFPTIKIERVEDLTKLDETIAEIKKFDGIFITSPNAAEPFLERLKNRAFRGRIYVLGRRTQQLFASARIETEFNSDAKNILELLDSVPESDLEGKRFLFLRGNRSLRAIPERLNEIADVEELIVYRTVATEADVKQSDKIAEKLRNNEFAAVCFFSPSGVEGFLDRFAEFDPGAIKIAAIGKTTAEFIKRKILRVDFVSAKPSAEDFAAGLIQYLRNL